MIELHSELTSTLLQALRDLIRSSLNEILYSIVSVKEGVHSQSGQHLLPVFSDACGLRMIHTIVLWWGAGYKSPSADHSAVFFPLSCAMDNLGISLP
jgi:hypothetical protein